ncbi:hypothetical protein PIROE2DRAFT_10514 [Piromyces sp. E2]|nr:hypothetical protein PIROE2DRAFT_10514 [Piromyces sp. E2]|eukprot:OUM63042.1 hypothetical protein PIROE2DRAFT_10514 [Piromyces sp. E2]
MSGTEVAIEFEPVNNYDDDDDKSKKPLLPIANVPNSSTLSTGIFLNKYIFSYADFEFPFPIFVTW